MYLSAESIFCAGNCYRWMRDQLCPGLSYREKDEMASLVPPGSHGLIFTPAMSGGNAMDKSVNIRGSFNGLDLRHTRPDMIRSVMEGVCLNLKLNLDELARNVPLSGDMLIVGGGGKSGLWRQIFSDVYNMEITESVVGEDAGSLGPWPARGRLRPMEKHGQAHGDPSDQKPKNAR
jgi:sugar (pentulose or hexulose) kinase